MGSGGILLSEFLRGFLASLDIEHMRKEVFLLDIDTVFPQRLLQWLPQSVWCFPVWKNIVQLLTCFLFLHVLVEAIIVQKRSEIPPE
jgi:hypothetical protein